MKPRSDFAHIHGLLLLDKPTGLSSNAALQRARKLLSARKAGHTGSLDPAASGLLPLCFGEATKLARYGLDTDKRYRTRIHLGVTTDTGDSEGRVLTRSPVPSIDCGMIEEVIARFRGPIQQTPPMYSALKQDGTRLYDLARKGIEVAREPRQVEIYSLHLVDYQAPVLELDVHCSKGTYIRTLGEDIGHAIGCGAHVDALRRTSVGCWDLNEAVPLAELEQLDLASRRCLLRPLDSLVIGLPEARCDEDASTRLCHGQAVASEPYATEGLIRLYDHQGTFFGIGYAGSDGLIRPQRMFHFAAGA